MAAEIAHIAEFEDQVVAWLPLDIQRVVVGVGQFVGAVIDAQRDGLAASSRYWRYWAGTCSGRRIGIGRRGALDVGIGVSQVAGRSGVNVGAERIAAFLQPPQVGM